MEKSTSPAPPVKITIINFDSTGFHEREVRRVEDCYQVQKGEFPAWINFSRRLENQELEKFGEHFDFHPIILDSIEDPILRPRLQDFDNYILIVLSAISFNPETHQICADKGIILLGKKLVITFLPKEELFTAMMEWLRELKTTSHKMRADYLVYAILDTVVDNYLVTLEQIWEQIDSVEEGLLTNPTRGTLQLIHDLKQEMISLRKSIWPLRGVVGSLTRLESPLVNQKTKLYLLDVFDHITLVIDTMEAYREMLSGMLESYLSSISNKLNEVMKVLTIFSTIFIPITFVASIYGMNFQYMPELTAKYGYIIFWVVILLMSGTMLLYFRKKKWL